MTEIAIYQVIFTETEQGNAFDGEQEYFPESAKSAFCIRRKEVVMSPFSKKS
jgi:hypothetical protein